MVSPSNLMNSSSRGTSSTSCFHAITILRIYPRLSLSPPEIFEIEDEKFFSKFCYAKLIFRGWISLGGRKREKDEKSISILRYSNRKNSYTNCINSDGTLLPLETSFFVNRYQKYCEKLERFGRATPLFQFLSSIFSPGKWDLFTRFKRLTFVV